VWVFWSYAGRDYLSRIRDLSVGGLFIQTDENNPVGVTANLHFLVQEGQIRAEAIVRHARKGDGLGLKFTAVSDPDRPHLAALMNRLRSLSRNNVHKFSSRPLG
jgi:hypothetical protein